LPAIESGTARPIARWAAKPRNRSRRAGGHVGDFPESIRLELAETFCSAIEQLPGMSGVVRLHPSEDLASYQTMIARHPSVSFVENKRVSLDEALAATDVVVVRASGFGSDALVKRKPVVVLSPDKKPTGHDGDLIELAGCPHVHDSNELAAVLAGWCGIRPSVGGMSSPQNASSRDSARLSETSPAGITAAAVRAMADRRTSREPSASSFSDSEARLDVPATGSPVDVNQSSS